MEVIDAQVHVVPPGDPDPGVTIEAMLTAMAEQEVDAAVVTARSRDTNNDYLLAATARYPERFAAVGRVDPNSPDLAEDMRTWRTQPGMVGVRLLVTSPGQIAAWESGGFQRLFGAAQAHQVPLCIWAPGRLIDLKSVVQSFPALPFVIDHLGLPQPTRVTERDDPPFRQLRELLELATLPNAVVKLTAAPTLSLRSYPFADLWPALHKVISRFGPDRIMWGSDWTRVDTHSYAEGISYLRDTTELSAREKALLLGGTLRRVFGWPRPHAS